MVERSTQRPESFTKPAHWSNDPPPKPQKVEDDKEPRELSPTRYGDWESKGIAIDF